MGAAHSGACAWRYGMPDGDPACTTSADWTRASSRRRRRLHENRLDVAERILKPHLKEDPFDVRAIRMLAELAARIGRLKDSETAASAGTGDRPELHRRRAPIWRWCLAGLGGRRKRSSCSTRFSRPSRIGLGHLTSRRRRWAGSAISSRRLEIYEQVLATRAEPAARAAELRPHAEDRRAAGRGRRRLSQGDRAQSGAGRSLVEPRQSQDRQVRRRRHRGDGAGACRAPTSRTTTASTSSSRWARRFTISVAVTRRSRIIRRAMRFGANTTRSTRDHLTNSSIAASSCSPRKSSPAAGRQRRARSDLHRRHAARGIHSGRADPVVAQPGRRHVGASRTCRRLPAAAANIRRRQWS